jgi:hypothetical protein
MRREILTCKKILTRHKCKNSVMTLLGMRLRSSHNNHPVTLIQGKAGRETATSDLISRIYRALSSNSHIGSDNSHMALRRVVM